MALLEKGGLCREWPLNKGHLAHRVTVWDEIKWFYNQGWS